ncbi:MAG: hypothetical protein J5693_02970 [Bacteroidales bacterium]|nr:hypothetical protein [Bacteroidales bacterium]
MKRFAIVLTIALLIAGCQGRNKQQKVFYESDIKEEIRHNEAVDYIEIYLRAHDLDSLKQVVEMDQARAGRPMPALPDSVNQLWSNMLNEILLRRGEVAFDIMFDTHRKDIADYLRMDFINYGFITKVYLPYKATVSTREEYGEICIKELEQEFIKAQQGLMMGQGIPSHYEHLLMDLFYAYVNYEQNDKALNLCDEILAFFDATGGKNSLNYANMLCNKANLLNNTGSAYSAAIAARQAIKIYEDYMAAAKGDEPDLEKVAADKKSMEEKLKLWQEK